MAAYPLILCYHGVSAGWENALSIDPAEFDRQLSWLIRRGYRAASAGEILRGRGKLLHVTFDDGLRSVSNAIPVLKRLGIPATVFVCTGYPERTGAVLDVPELAEARKRYQSELTTMVWEELRVLADHGVEIGSHTVTHAHLRELSDRELSEELMSSKERLEDELERPCPFLAYPFGESDERVRIAARQAGYEAAFGLPGDISWSDRFQLPRIGVWRGDSPFRIALKNSAVGRMVFRRRVRKTSN